MKFGTLFCASRPLLGLALILACFEPRAHAQGAAGKWSHFKFHAGQSFKYDMKSERGLKGWLSLKVEEGGKDGLKVTIAGKWVSDFSETAVLKPGMDAQQFLGTFKNPDIMNAALTLCDVDAAVLEHATWKDGFHWAQGDNTVDIKGEKEVAGVKGLLVNSTSKLFGKVKKKTYAVNLDLPLPLFAEVPAANDTWTYSLVQK